MAEAVEAEAAPAVDQQQAGRAAQAIACHGDRNARGVVMAVDRDRTGDAIFVEEGFERYRRHRGMMFEHAVQGDRRHRVGGEQFVNPPELRQALGDARSEEHTSELQSLMRISYAVSCLKK